MKVNAIIRLGMLLISIAMLMSGCSQKSGNKAEDKDESRIRCSNITMVSRITGESLPTDGVPNPNNTATKYDVCGTDLGIMWQIEGNRIGLFFGDTNGEGFEPNKNGGGNGSNWRSNVLAFSSDTYLEDGLTIDSMLVDTDGKAREICAGGKANPSVYQTSIPTSAIHVGHLDCVHFMNIYDWGAPYGRWLTNYSSLYISRDGGHDWERVNDIVFDPDSHFSQVAYAKKDGWVYMIGTQAGRGDDAYLARFKEEDLLKKNAYEYWNADSCRWICGREAAATPIIKGPVGEASLMWHKKYERWILTYNYDPNYDEQPCVKTHAILYRDAKDITRWNEPQVLLTAERYPGLYCAYMHPLKDNEDKLWFIMSLWGPYNTFLMRADLQILDAK